MLTRWSNSDGLGKSRPSPEGSQITGATIRSLFSEETESLFSLNDALHRMIPAASKGLDVVRILVVTKRQCFSSSSPGQNLLYLTGLWFSKKWEAVMGGRERWLRMK
jgi:hypothetical protein